MRSHPFLTILVIEDNQDHVAILRWAFERGRIPTRINLARDGDTALDYLLRRNGFEDPLIAPRPDLVFLDLDLPGVNGKEVLRIIKTDKTLHTIPVIVLSSSERDEDIAEAYELGANTFVSKTRLFDEFSFAVELIQQYWASVAKLPPKS